MNQNALRLKYKIATTSLKLWIFLILVKYSIKWLLESTLYIKSVDFSPKMEWIISLPLFISIGFYFLCMDSIIKFFSYGMLHVKKANMKEVAKQFADEFEQQQEKEAPQEKQNDQDSQK